MILAGDVGATKVLLEIGDVNSGRWKPTHSKRLSAADIDNFTADVTAFLKEWSGAKPARSRITAAAFGVRVSS